MSTFGEALAHAQGEGTAILHSPPAIYPGNPEKEKAAAEGEDG